MNRTLTMFLNDGDEYHCKYLLFLQMAVVWATAELIRHNNLFEFPHFS